MGGDPQLAFLNVAWPARLPERWQLGFLRGFGAEARLWRIAWAGGDVSSTNGPAVVPINLAGEAPAPPAPPRAGGPAPEDTPLLRRGGGGAARVQPPPPHRHN